MRSAGALRITPPRRNGAGPPRRAESAAAPSAALRIITSIVANVTLLTALLFFFGYLYTQVFFAYFRVHYTVLDQSVNDILARGVDGLFMPLAGLAAAVLIVLCAVRYLKARLRGQTWLAMLRICVPMAAVAGLALVTAAAIIAVNPAPFRQYAGLPGLAFSLGVLLLFFTWRHVITTDPGPGGAAASVAEWGIAFLLVVIGLFWAAGDYSSAVGTQRAIEAEAGLPARPNVLVYSAKSLNLTVSDVHEVTCRDTDGEYRYRYDGLKLLFQYGGQYVLVPATWTSASGTTIVLPRADSLRLEFTPPGTPAGRC